MFFAMVPPTVTHQEKKIGVRKGKPYTYEPEELKAARAKLEAHLGQRAPAEPITGAIQLVVKWCFPITGEHVNGEYKTSKPDTDNLQKLLKDVMTDVGYWKDDAQVASEIVEKFWATIPGIFIRVEPIEVDRYVIDG
jgi:Holliday junction resolvase RusA-like endonuclease